MNYLKHQLMLNKDMSWKPCYLKSEADKVIAELNRVLWLARANYCHNFRIDWYIKRHPNTKRCHLTMENTLIIAELKCRAKAKEYK